MAEESFPIVDNPMSAAQWSAVTRGIGNGVLDEGGFPYRLIFKSDANATNQGIIRCPTVEGKKYGQAIVDGFYHKYDSDLVLDFPAVTKETTYYVVLECVPTRAADGQPPVQAKVVTSLDYTQNKNYVHLYDVTRQPNQLLTDATVRMVRPRVAPVMVFTSTADMPVASKTLWGTLAIVHNGRANDDTALYMSMTGDDEESVNGWFWKRVYDPNANGFVWDQKGDSGTYTSPAGEGFKRAIGRRQKRRKLRGRVGLISGNDFVKDGEYRVFGTGVGSGDTPERVQAFTTTVGGVSGGIGFARVEVRPDGDVVAWPSKNTAWISIDGIEWEVP